MNKEKLKENKEHGGPLFHFCIYYNNPPYKQVIKHHWHKEIEFIYMKKGSATFQIGSNKYNVNPNQALFINSEEVHSSCNYRDCEFHAIMIDTNLLNSNIEDNCQLRYLNPLLNNKYKLQSFIEGREQEEEEIIKELLNIIKINNEKTFGYELLIKSLLFKILYLFLSKNKYIEVNKKDETRTEHIKKALTFIHKNYEKDIGLDEMAEETNLSKYYFCRIFKKIIGETPIEYLNHFRINQACQILISNNNIPILNLSLDVGYNSFSYFIKIFKKYKGITPTEFIADHLKQDNRKYNAK